MTRWTSKELAALGKKKKSNKGMSNPRRNVPYGRKEEVDHDMLCKYMTLRYKGVLWKPDMSGIPLSKPVAARYWRIAEYRGFPDWVCFAHCRDWFCGLHIEIKVHGFDLLGVLDGKAGGEKMQQHHQEQLERIWDLRKLGRCAGFAVGFDNCKGLLDAYMEGDLKKINRHIYPKITPIY
jgi:hypothetical protein